MSGVLGVIPARGGSKRLPRKNVIELDGRPMLAYTVDAALASGVFDEVIVSTDDPAIADVARACGAAVPFLRSAELANDHTHVSAVTLDALARIDPNGARFDVVAQLMPNCPLRTADDVAASHERFGAVSHEAMLSVTRYGWFNPWWAMELDPEGTLVPLFADRLAQRSQDLPTLYCPSGAIWWAHASALRHHKTFHVPERAAFELPWDHALDIDDEADLRMAHAVMARGRESAAG